MQTAKLFAAIRQIYSFDEFNRVPEGIRFLMKAVLFQMKDFCYNA